MKRSALLFLASSALVPCFAFAFGAIAVDDQRGDKDPAYGFATGEPTKEAAQHKAMRYCREHGPHCKSIVWFKSCGAYATSRSVYGYGYGSSKGKATSDALKMCGRHDCKIVVAQCE